MMLLRPDPDQAALGLRAMKMVAAIDGSIAAPTRNLLAAAQRHILGTALDIDALAPIEPGELAQGLADPGLRAQFVDAMLVMSLSAGVPTKAQIEVVQQFAAALEVAPTALHDLQLLVDRHTLLFRLDFLRRGHIADMVRQQYEDAGLIATVKAVLGLRGFLEDRGLADCYHALAELPEGTLGRTLYHHYRDGGFSFPGEKRGFPEAAVYHDIAHVLAGYGTDPEGELQIAAFVSGFRRSDPVYVLLFALLTFNAGVNVTPIPQPHIEGLLERPGLAEKLLHALVRGSQLNTDLSDHWDFWPLMALPLAEVRRRLNVVD